MYFQSLYPVKKKIKKIFTKKGKSVYMLFIALILRKLNTYNNLKLNDFFIESLNICTNLYILIIKLKTYMGMR